MELLYVWINKSKNNAFAKQDVLLADQYCIETTFEIIEEKATLTISKNDDYYNIFKNDVIRNVTGIVGSNGAGKTTLLNYLFANDVQPMSKNINKSFEQYYKNFNAENRTIQIFSSNNKIVIIHNLEEVSINSNLECEIIKRTETQLRENMTERKYLETLTKVYLTNSNYTPEMITSDEGKNLNKIVLTTNSLRTLASNYYKKNTTLEQSTYSYTQLQEMIANTKNAQDFQCICDLVYISQLIENESINSFLGRIPTDLQISSLLLPDILEKYKPTIIETDSKIRAKINEWNQFCQNLRKQDFKPIDFLKLNFVFEVDYLLNALPKLDEITNQNDVTIIDYIYTKMSDEINKSKCKPVKIYYENAVKEIDELENIFKNIDTFMDIYQYLTDPHIYQRGIKINGQYKCDEFVKYVSNIANQESFFVLKYLKVENMKMSSGERAYLNFFSWLNLLSFFNQISSNFIKNTNENILLLIDEIDLYCHPEWQRLFIKNLLDELTSQFKNKKIQIIFTTHSPIILSDIPRANTVYIKNDEIPKPEGGSSSVEDRGNHSETFAGNIYKLFNDSFFLNSKGAVGEYAKDKINNMYSELKECSTTEKPKQRKKEEYQFMINSIGESIVKNKLNELYLKNAAVVEDKEELIKRQKKEIDELKAKLRKNILREPVFNGDIDND